MAHKSGIYTRLPRDCAHRTTLVSLANKNVASGRDDLSPGIYASRAWTTPGRARGHDYTPNRS